MSGAIREKRKNITFSILGKVCNKCGSTENLEIDHINPFTKNLRAGDGSIWDLPDEEFYVELKKCQVLCRKCHVDKSLADYNMERIGDKHNYSRYANHKCRCNICVKDHSRYNAEYYIRKKIGLP